MRLHLISCTFATSLILLGMTGCAVPAAPDRTVGVLGSPGQARKLPDSAAAVPQPAAEAQARMPAPVQANAQAGLKTAEDAYARGDWLTAAREFKALTSVYPGNGQVWFGLGAASALAGNLDEASSAFEGALRIDPRDARVAYNLGLIRLSQAEIALGAASANSASAPAPVQIEIARLSRDLAPVFRRSADSTPVAAAPAASVAPVGFRMQDPARSSGNATGPGGAYGATPMIPSSPATR